MEKTSARKYKSYCRCTAVHTSDDSMIAPGTRRKLADQPRNKKPRARNLLARRAQIKKRGSQMLRGVHGFDTEDFAGVGYKDIVSAWRAEMPKPGLYARAA